MLQFRIAFVATIIGLVLFGAQSALAGPFYVSTSFGPNWDRESNLPFVSEDTGLVGMVALGTYITSVDGLRFEVEASFRNHDGTLGPIPFEHDTTAVMVNVVFDAKGLAIGNVVPYALLGGGAAWTDLTIGGLGPLTIENSGMAYQAGAGFNYQVSEDVGVGLGYRYFQGPELSLFGFDLDGGSNHALLATATVKLQ